MVDFSWHVIHDTPHTKYEPFNTHFSVYHKKSISFIKEEHKKKGIRFYSANIF